MLAHKSFHFTRSDKISFSKAFNDRRLDRIANKLSKSLEEKKCASIRRLAGCRRTEVAFHRLLQSSKVTSEKMIKSQILKTSEIGKDLNRVLLIQDSTFLCFGNRNDSPKKGLGVGGNDLSLGFYLHPMLAVDADSSMCLGIAALHHWVRSPLTEKQQNISQKRHDLPIEEKESYRWISNAQEAKKAFSDSTTKIIVADRESDIYEEFYYVPDEHTHLITRSSHNRHLSDGRLFEKLDSQPVSGSYKEHIPAITGKRKARTVALEVRYCDVELKKPDRTNKDIPRTLSLRALDVREKGNSKENIHWRILTTLKIECLEDALKIISWYKQRWQIEQLFRTLKRQGFNIEESQLESYESLHKLAILALLTAANILKLTLAREGKQKRPLTDVFEEEDSKLLAAINRRVEGNTKKQQNPHPRGRLSWASWIIARLGGWTGYSCEHPPGPITMYRGLSVFESLKLGWAMASEDVCIR